MLKIPRAMSVYISLSVAVIFFLVCLAGVFVLPGLTELLINTPDNIGTRADITQAQRMVIHLLAYLVLLSVMLADVLMFVLLLRVKGGRIFTDASVALIRGVSWCCFLLCVVLCGLGIWFQLAFLLALAAAFLGICLRVVKNVIEEATCIKNENDLTV